MKPVHGLLLVGLLIPHSAVFVKGHGKAAQRARENLQVYTCYCSSEEPENSVATLQVGHITDRKKQGRSWLVMFLTDEEHQVLWQGKAEEYPWPFPSALGRLLRNLAKCTCGAPEGADLARFSGSPDLSRFDCLQMKAHTAIEPR